VIVPLGDGGKIPLYTLSTLHLLGDVTGYITDGTAPCSLFAGQTRPNAAILPIGDGGNIAFYSLRGVDLLADVFGWFLE
jgi:hypothetical protein